MQVSAEFGAPEMPLGLRAVYNLLGIKPYGLGGDGLKFVPMNGS